MSNQFFCLRLIQCKIVQQSLPMQALAHLRVVLRQGHFVNNSTLEPNYGLHTTMQKSLSWQGIFKMAKAAYQVAAWTALHFSDQGKLKAASFPKCFMFRVTFHLGKISTEIISD